MSETTEANTNDPIVKLGRDLQAIIELAGALETQAIHKANDRLMPGGHAMVALGPVADLAAHAAWLEAAEEQAIANALHAGLDPRKVGHLIETDDDEWEPPLQTLRFWSEDWRRIHGLDYQQTVTIASEARFLYWAREWAWDNEPRFDHFAADVNRARCRLENLLHAGTRPELTRVLCDREHCAKHPRLVKLRGHGDLPDNYKCPSCKTRFDEDAFQRAYSHQLRSEGAAKFVALPDAIGTLKVQGRPERTIRKWLQPPLEHVADRCDECGLDWDPDEYPACPAETDDGEECGGFLTPRYSGDANSVVESYCEIATHRVWVWWPDLWRLHLSTKTRRRVPAA